MKNLTGGESGNKVQLGEKARLWRGNPTLSKSSSAPWPQACGLRAQPSSIHSFSMNNFATSSYHPGTQRCFAHHLDGSQLFQSLLILQDHLKPCSVAHTSPSQAKGPSHDKMVVPGLSLHGTKERP